MKYPRILYFIAGPRPSMDDQIAVDELAPANVVYRNADHVKTTGALELCDGVTGPAVPDRYKKEKPGAKEAIDKFVAARDKAHKDARKKAAEAKKVATAKEAAVTDRAADAATDAAAKVIADAAKTQAKADKAKTAAKDAAAKAAKVAAADGSDSTPPTDEQKTAAGWANNA